MIKARDADILLSVFLVCAGLYVSLVGSGYGYAEDGTPAAGFFPVWVGAGIVITSSLNLLRIFRGAGMRDQIPLGEIGRVVLASVGMVLFVVASLWIGMLAAAFLLMLGIGMIYGPASKSFYFRLLGVVVFATALLWLIFAKLLAVPLV